MINDYVVTEFLGQGSFGKVKLAIKHNGPNEERYAMKIFKKSQLRRKKEYFKDSEGRMRHF